MNFNQFRNLRLMFLKEHKTQDHAVILGDRPVLISAPHGVSQVRLGKQKVAEIGTIPFALTIQKKTNSHLIAKTKNSFDDANFDEISKFKTKLQMMVENKNIAYLFDIHGLAKKREMDINLGINFGKSISSKPALFDTLVENLKNAGFMVSIDQPFSGGPKTIAGSTNEKFNIWTVQVEINSKITNNPENISRLNKLINVFENFINNLN